MNCLRLTIDVLGVASVAETGNKSFQDGILECEEVGILEDSLLKSGVLSSGVTSLLLRLAVDCRSRGGLCSCDDGAVGAVDDGGANIAII